MGECGILAEITVKVEQPEPKDMSEVCRGWVQASLVEWMLRLLIVTVGAAAYLWSGWVYYVAAGVSTCVAAAHVIREERLYGWERTDVRFVCVVSVVFVLGVCALSHFLTTVAVWFVPAASVITAIYSNTVMRHL